MLPITFSNDNFIAAVRKYAIIYKGFGVCPQYCLSEREYNEKKKAFYLRGKTWTDLY